MEENKEEVKGEEKKPEPKKPRKRKVWIAPKSEETKRREAQEVLPNSPISDASMRRLAQVMNDSPTIKKLKGTEWEIHALKVGAQWLIAEEACKISVEEHASMGDVIKRFATSMPSVCRCLTIALLNDKDKIYGEEYRQVYDALLWGDYDLKDWATLLFEVVSLVDINFFYASTDAIRTVKQILTRKTTAQERKSYPQEQNTGK